MIDWVYQNMILPAFESGWKRRKTFQHWHALEESQWWTTAAIKSMQLTQLRGLLKHCQQHSTWHQRRWAEHGLNVQSVTSLDDLARFPITTRDGMRQQWAELQRTENRMPAVKKATGGSSGTPLEFLIDLDSNDRRVAAAYRGYGWAGAHPGTKQSHLWGIDLGGTSFPKRLKERVYTKGLYRRDMLNSFQMTESNVDRYVDRINHYRPKVMVAYANPLFVLARAIEEQALDVYCPESIIVGSEKLHDHQRGLVERVFGCPVYETYGSREFTLVAAQCEQLGGLHMTSENLIVETADDHGIPCEAGAEGQVLVTDLRNMAMPFIRYAIGDRAIAGLATCPCGRGLPILEKIVGRQMDILTLPDGRTVPGIFFPHFVKDVPSIRQFQVHQTASDLICLKIVVQEDWSDDDSESLKRRIEQHIGRSSKIAIQRVAKIDLTAAGKLRVVVGYQKDEAETGSRIAG